VSYIKQKSPNLNHTLEYDIIIVRTYQIVMVEILKYSQLSIALFVEYIINQN
jgi:hypothetical protein